MLKPYSACPFVIFEPFPVGAYMYNPYQINVRKQIKYDWSGYSIVTGYHACINIVHA